ncbi:hypothetical protein K7432_014414, partial [Basidiobolus ranarum]
MSETSQWRFSVEQIITQQSQLLQLLSQQQQLIATAYQNLPRLTMSQNAMSIKPGKTFKARGVHNASKQHYAVSYHTNAALQWYHNRTRAAATGEIPQSLLRN